ncbi:Uncharacterised protein [Achromobacter xylosoxidans]|nr:Uncharacterised protein [Achromobacter xylosoxidans]
MSSATSTPAARARSMLASVAALLPQLAGIMHLWCDSTVAQPVRRPTASTSSTAASTASPSLRMWLVCSAPRAAATRARPSSSASSATPPGWYARPVLNPTAPASSASASMRSIARCSSALGRAAGSRMAARRRLAWPTRAATLIIGRCASSAPKYMAMSANSGESPSRANAAAVLPGSGAGAPLMPQLPTTTDVMPWLVFHSRPGFSTNIRSSWPWVSMKPGATMLPPASRRRSAGAADRSPMAAMRSPRMPTSARRRGPPSPSITQPPSMTRSSFSCMQLPP